MPRFYQILGSFFVASLVLISVMASAEESATRPLVLAVHPYLPYDEIHMRYRPLADYLQAQLDTPVVVRVGRNYDEHIKFIGKNEVDIAYMGPAAYLEVVRIYGEKPGLARLEINGRPHFHGYLVTAKDSGINEISALRDKRFAFGDPKSTMSHLVPRHMLLNEGVQVRDLADYSYLGSHKNVALGVLTGDFDAGAVKEEVMDAYRSKGLRAFAKSPAYSEHLFVARSDLDVDLVGKIRNAMYELSNTPEGRELLKGIKSGVTALVPVQDSDYDNLRQVLDALAAQGVL